MINIRTLTKPNVKDGVRMVREWGGGATTESKRRSQERRPSKLE